MSEIVKTADWTRAKEIQRGDMIASPAPVFRVRNVHREGDEVVVMGGPGVVRRFAPEDEVNVWRKTASGAITATVTQGDGGVVRLTYSQNGKVVGSARMLGSTIGDIDVKPSERRKGVGTAILSDCVRRGGSVAFAGSEAGAALMKSFGFEQRGEGKWVLPKEPVQQTATKTAMKVNVPESEFDHFWVEPPAGNEEFWALRFPPKAKPGDPVIFHMNKKPVAEAVISRIEKPGEHSCEQTGRFKNKWKVYWSPESFKKIAKQASPDFGYAHYNDREEDLQKLEWEVWKSGSGFMITAYQSQADRYEDPARKGVIAVGKITIMKIVRGVAVVYDPYVERDWRGTGLGQLLYDRAIAESKARGFKLFCSDRPKDRSGDADSAWNRLKKRYPVRVGDYGQYIIDLQQVTAKQASSLSDRIDEVVGNMMHDAHNGDRWSSNCTDQADHAMEEIGAGGEIWGYSKEENPTAQLADQDGQGGHDFAIIGEFLVDPWAADYFGTPGKIPLSDHATINKLYGDPKTWTRIIGSAWGTEGRSQPGENLPDALRKQVTASAAPTDFESFLKKSGGIEKWEKLWDYSRWETKYKTFGFTQQQYADWYAKSPADRRQAYLGDLLDLVHKRFVKWVELWQQKQFPITLYRVVNVPDEASIRTDGVGIYWSYDESKAFTAWGWKKKGNEYLLRGVVANATAVNWYSTLWHNIYNGEDEYELQLKPGAAIEITGIRDGGSNGGTWREFREKMVTASQKAAELTDSWKVWDDGLPSDAVARILEMRREGHGDEYEFRSAPSDFHHNELFMIEGRKIKKQAAGWKKWHTIRKGTKLYHGTSDSFDPADIETPAWFSTSRAVAERFMNFHGKGREIHEYKVVTPIRLPLVKSPEDMQALADQFDLDLSGREGIVDSIAQSGLSGWIIPENYENGDDILLVSTNGIEPVDNSPAPKKNQDQPSILTPTLKPGLVRGAAIPASAIEDGDEISYGGAHGQIDGTLLYANTGPGNRTFTIQGDDGSHYQLSEDDLLADGADVMIGKGNVVHRLSR